MSDETKARLQAHVKDGVGLSTLINQAVESFLNGKDVALEGRSPIAAEEIEQLLPVLKALGKSVHINLFLELLDTQQGR